ncbi:MAG: Ig-like domain-containing protein, partial [Planctomycetota bacterium]|nr:Ig-like domain-containing protein [Planctomycetota bacterium]
AFQSDASNLVRGDTNDSSDIFVRDTLDASTQAVSVGEPLLPFQSRYTSADTPSISADGRYVAFMSDASNLVSGDTNGTSDVFVRDTLSNTTSRISLDTAGNQANSGSYAPSISADGRYVAFQSTASNLASGDTNDWDDIFVRDRQSNTTSRISVDPAGNQANSGSYTPSISADGRYVAFESTASNLVSGNTNGTYDIFVRDTLSNTTSRVSLDTVGTQANSDSAMPSISADGRYVAFVSSASNLMSGDTSGQDIFVRDLIGASTQPVSVGHPLLQCQSGNNTSSLPSISADGRYVAFQSNASDLVSGDTNGVSDIFVRDTLSNTTSRVSLDTAGTQANSDSDWPSISADGRYVAFSSDASNLVSGDTNGTPDIFVRDTLSNITSRVSVDTAGTQANSYSDWPSISDDGRYVAFSSTASNLVSDDTNGTSDIFVRDTLSNTTTRVSVDSAGIQANSQSYEPSISADGRYVAFTSWASNLVSGDTNGMYEVFVRDTLSNTTSRVNLDTAGNQADRESGWPSISADGRYVAFASTASNLVSGDTNGLFDIFVRDTLSNTTTRVSLDTAGTQANILSTLSSLSADGRYVAFQSGASNLVSGDTNATWDIFVRDTLSNTTTRISLDTAGNQANSDSSWPSISADGRYVAFQSDASNLVSGDTNGYSDVFRWSAVNLAPTDLSLSPSIHENQSVGANVGSFNTTDPDLPNDAHTYTLVDSANYPDNTSFTIVGSQLKTAAVFDYETKNIYSIRVRTTDQAGLFYEKAFTFWVVDIDEIPPTVTATSPADNARHVSPVANLVLTFSEDVQAGSGNILIKRTADNAVVETIDVQDGGKVTLVGATVTVDPAVTLAENTGYYVEIAPGAFTDLIGNEFAGITDATTWDFTTATAPVIVVGEHVLAANRANQVVLLYVTGDALVTGLNLRAQLGDGTGPGVEPVFTGVDFAGGIWAAHPYTVTGGPVSGAAQFLQASVVFNNAGDQVAANGLLVKLVIDTTGIQSGQFALSLAGTEIGSDTMFVLAGGTELSAAITNGRIDVIATAVADRRIFYNQSYFDGNSATANGADDNAIATDKQPLLPGQTATFANYTSYTRGLNGIMVDISSLANPAALSAAQFEFRVGNSNTPSGWAAAPAPISVTVREGAGTNGSDRVTLIWANNAIQKQWLQVLVLADGVTGLTVPDVFYFGNAIGEAGNSVVNTFVDGTDFAAARDNPRNFLNRAPVGFRFDYNRDSFVDGSDMAAARDNNTNFVTALKLITVPTPAPAGSPGATGGQAGAATLGAEGEALGGTLASSSPRTAWPEVTQAARAWNQPDWTALPQPVTSSSTLSLATRAPVASRLSRDLTPAADMEPPALTALEAILHDFADTVDERWSR